MTPAAWSRLKARLARSAFRSKFNLSAADRAYVAAKGLDVIERHAADFVRTRLAPAVPPHDGRQTPWHGHPVFVAQHATGCCCRGCLLKWHRIPKGRALTEEELAYVQDVLMTWIRDHLATTPGPIQPDLFHRPPLQSRGLTPAPANASFYRRWPILSRLVAR